MIPVRTALVKNVKSPLKKKIKIHWWPLEVSDLCAVPDCVGRMKAPNGDQTLSAVFIRPMCLMRRQFLRISCVCLCMCVTEGGIT